MEPAIQRIPALIEEQIEPWVWRYLIQFIDQARRDGHSVKRIHQALGFDEALNTPPDGMSEPVYALKLRYEELKDAHRTPEQDIELRDLTEAALDTGLSQPKLAELIGVSKGTIRNLAHPGYMEQTPEERAAYRAERAAARAAREELLG